MKKRRKQETLRELQVEVKQLRTWHAEDVRKILNYERIIMEQQDTINRLVER